MSLIGIIENGENDNVEFKETFWYDVRTNEKNRARKTDVTKAVCGLLNLQGGLVLIGVDDNCEIKGLSRDLSLYSGDNEIKKRDNLLKDVNSICKEHLGTQVIGLLTITYKDINNTELISIEVAPSDEPVFHTNKEFFLRNGPETIKLEYRELAKYMLKRFRAVETQSSLLSSVQQAPGMDERIGILKKFIKNLMIVYYSEGIYLGVHDPNINTVIYKLSKTINNFDNSTLSDYIRGGSTKPDYQKLSRIFFGCSRDSFSEKLEMNEISRDSIKRTKLVLAGDIAYLLYKWNEEKSETDRYVLEDIYDLLIIKTKNFERINFSSDITQNEFLSVVNILIGEKLIDISYKSEKTALGDTEWAIINEVNLISFYQWKSLFYLLEREEIKEIPMDRKGFCIRCKWPLILNKDYPFCPNCYRIWAKFGDWNYVENYCHNCGESAKTSRTNPLCSNCNPVED